jgi:hypothetical protein
MPPQPIGAASQDETGRAVVVIDEGKNDRGGTTSMQGARAVFEHGEVAFDPLAQRRSEW